jgi:hypothetical protein
MKVGLKDGQDTARWSQLEPGSYNVQFEHRTMDDLRAVNPEGREEEQIFSTVAQLSDINLAMYKTWVRPWLRPLANRSVADAAVHLHPLRSQRAALSDANVALRPLGRWAELVRADRHALAADHPGRQLEAAVSSGIEAGLNAVRDLRDQFTVQTTRLLFGPLGLGAWLPPRASDEARAVARAQQELEAARADVLARIADGGLAQAVCRIVLSVMVSTGAFDRRSLRLARLLADLPAPAGEPPQPARDWRRLMSDEARISAVAPVEALQALSVMLPDAESRERALAMAAAVMMIEPTVHQPVSEIFEMLMGMLGVDTDRVIGRAFQITTRLSPTTPFISLTPETPAAPAPRRTRSAGPRKQA